MLKFALKNRKALDAITGDRRMELRAFELSEREWTLAEQLRDVLEDGAFMKRPLAATGKS